MSNPEQPCFTSRETAIELDARKAYAKMQVQHSHDPGNHLRQSSPHAVNNSKNTGANQAKN
eukprot:1569105-Amphidinium_carterae.1